MISHHIINKKFENYRKWYSRPQNKQRLHVEPLLTIERSLQAGLKGESEIVGVGSEFHFASMFYGREAIVHYLDRKQETGSSTLAHYLAYSGFYIKIITALFDKDQNPAKRPGITYPDSCRLSFLLASFQIWGDAAWIGMRAYHSRDDDTWGGWRDKPLFGFMLRYHLVLTGATQPMEAVERIPNLGVYEGLFTHWGNEGKLKQVIADVCDYHVERSMEPPGREVYEFDFPPYDILPVEYMAYRALRERFGLTTPEVARPLITSPVFHQIPRTLPPCEDELLQRVLKAIHEAMPGLL